MSAFAVVTLLAAALADDAESDVIVGTEANWDELIASEKLTLVEFYAPWCGHCKSLAPEWEKAATALKGTATLVKVDATEEKSLGTKYGVKGFPTIKAYWSSEPTDYDGGRKEKDIVAWAKKMSGPAVHEVANFAAVEELLKDDDVVVTGYFENAESAAAFTKIAGKNRKGYTWAAIYDAAVAKEQDLNVPSVVIHKTFDSKKDIMPEYDEDKIIDFVKVASVRIFGEVGPDNYQAYVDRGLPFGWVFIDPSAEETLEKLKTIFSEIGAAEHLKGKISLVYLDAIKFGQMADKVGLKKKNWPALAIDADGENFVFDEEAELTKETVEPWLKKWSEGKIEKTVKSDPEPEPAQDPETGVTTLVGTTVDKVVDDETKNVLVEFYAPWCGHCKKMIPDYEKLGKDFLENDSVVIAKLDATTNGTPKGAKVEGFPTLYWWKKGAIEKYQGGRDYDSMKKFVEENI